VVALVAFLKAVLFLILVLFVADRLIVNVVVKVLWAVSGRSACVFLGEGCWSCTSLLKSLLCAKSRRIPSGGWLFWPLVCLPLYSMTMMPLHLAAPQSLAPNTQTLRAQRCAFQFPMFFFLWRPINHCPNGSASPEQRPPG